MPKGRDPLAPIKYHHGQVYKPPFETLLTYGKFLGSDVFREIEKLRLIRWKVAVDGNVTDQIKYELHRLAKRIKPLLMETFFDESLRKFDICSFTSFIDPTFWSQVNKLKVNKWQLDETPKKIFGTYSTFALRFPPQKEEKNAALLLRQGVPFPSSRLQQEQEKEAIAQAAAHSAQQHAIAQIQAAHQLHQQHQQPQLHGNGYGVRVPIQQVPQHLHGKPAFYDANRGILYDGQQAFFYQPDANSNATFTAVELGHGGHHHQQQIFGGQQAYHVVPTHTAIEVSAQPSGQSAVSHGFGNRVLLLSNVTPTMLGKPAFYDSNRGVYYDGQHVYAYQPSEESHLVTAIETSEQQLSANQQQQRAFYQQQVQDLNNNRSGYLFSA
uniref:Ubiquitin-like modifier-activating enzyme Atg7 N-terminal domain-containing protein n=1 Tax=Ditylenchus dipsaci TaxID=166011 RepID=A0A915DT80_9BILA